MTITIGHAQTGVQITINPSPTLYSITGGGTYCAGLSGMPVGLSLSEVDVNYQLQVGGTNIGLPLPGTGAPLNFGNQLIPGNYTVIATSTITGCSLQMSNTAVVTVNPIPNVTLTASGPITFCGSGSVTLTANAGNGVTYQWSKNGVSIPGANLNQYVANSTGMYTCVATNILTGCFNDNDTMVMVNPLPQVFTASANPTNFCQGGSGVTIQLNGSQSGVNYQLMLNGSPVGTPVAGTGTALNWYNQAAAGSYSVVTTDNITSCTIGMNGIPVVTMNPLPDNALTITGFTSVCQGSSVSFSTSSIPNATSYAWSVPVGSTITGYYGNGTTITVDIGTTSGNVTVAGVNSCGSGTAFILPITVTAAPVGTINASPGTVICEGTSVDLNVTSNQSGSTFLWSTSQTGPDITVTPMNSQSYSVTVTGTNSCTATASIAINVHNSPNVTLNLTEDNFCTDVTSAVLSGGLPVGGVYSGDYVLGGNIIHPNGEGIYIITYTYTDGYGCSNSATDLLTINATPVITVTNLTNPIYADTPPFSVANQFSPIGGTCSGPGVINNVFNPAAVGQGVYIITYTYTHPITGCIGSDDITIFVGATGVDEVTAAANMITIFPNPTSTLLNLSGIDMQEIRTLKIINMLGEVIFITDITAENMSIDVSALAPGTYIISFMDTDGISVGKRFMKSE